MRVLIPSALRSYTDGRNWVEARGATLAEVFDELERQYPGIRFRAVDEQGRLRRHVRVFVLGRQVLDLSDGLEGVDEVLIVQALSGG